MQLFTTYTEPGEDFSNSCSRNICSANVYVAAVGFPNWVNGYGVPVSDCMIIAWSWSPGDTESTELSYLEHSLESFFERALPKSRSIKI